ncbi:MAG: cytochrome c oxidase accessory protein CcoG, partial [Bdellovibrionaceae bacterium]|nr:cytochrome c oxidase accessory protein CcoG [Pseudobdellovibrionaceae bacterium]
PRKGRVHTGTKPGDCVACNRCVQVCPTGIDIRKGVQMECIACTACMDACDEIMTKVNKPTGLIRYASLGGQSFRLLRPRSIAYMILIFVAVSGLAWSLARREPLAASALRAKDLPYQILTNDSGEKIILNHLQVHLHNQSFHTARYQIGLSEQAMHKDLELTIAQNPVEVEAGQSKMVHVFIRARHTHFDDQGQLRSSLRITDLEATQHSKDLSITLVGPRKDAL